MSTQYKTRNTKRYLRQMLREMRYLLTKDLKLELRKSHVLSGLALYILSTIYVCYLSFGTISDLQTWNALIWIIVLFSAFNGLARTFDGETREQEIYFYTLTSPQGLLFSKIIFNIFMMLIMTVLAILIYSVMLGTADISLDALGQFGIGLILGSCAFSTTLTLISGIAAKSNNNVGLMALLGFPVIIPSLLILSDFSEKSLAGMSWSVNMQNLLFLIALNVAIAALSYILFPYLWRD